MKLKPEEKRLLSERRREVRKEKSREAARCRRGKECEVFANLIDALPIPDLTKATMDKSSIMRLSINYMKMRNLFSNIWEMGCGEDDRVGIQDLLETAHGFVCVISPASELIYVSENIKKILGLSQYDVIGNRMSEFVHPCDLGELESCVKSRERSVSLLARFKTTLLPKGRVVNLKSASYKVINFTGKRLIVDIKPDPRAASDPLNECLLLTGTAIPHPSHIEDPLDTMTWASSHNLDMRFTDCDSNVEELASYPMEQLMGTSLYKVVHGQDAKAVQASFKQLFSKGQVQTPPYRFLAYGGGYLRVYTQATMIYNSKTNKPQHIVCVHSVLSGIEESDVIESDIQIGEKRPSLLAVPVKEKQERKSCSQTSGSHNDIMALTASMFSNPCDILTSTASVFSDDPMVELCRKNPIAAATAGVFSEEASFSRHDKQDLERLVEQLDSDMINSGLVVDTSGLDELNDEDFYLRAPYIPMDTSDDVNLLDGYLSSADLASPTNDSFRKTMADSDGDSSLSGTPAHSPYPAVAETRHSLHGAAHRTNLPTPQSSYHSGNNIGRLTLSPDSRSERSADRTVNDHPADTGHLSYHRSIPSPLISSNDASPYRGDGHATPHGHKRKLTPDRDIVIGIPYGDLSQSTEVLRPTPVRPSTNILGSTGSPQDTTYLHKLLLDQRWNEHLAQLYNRAVPRSDWADHQVWPDEGAVKRLCVVPPTLMGRSLGGHDRWTHGQEGAMVNPSMPVLGNIDRESGNGILLNLLKQTDH